MGSPFPDIPPGYRDLPSERKWRPFQLAFILMNIAGMSSHEAPERSLVDLIWFPTGGGKTEAYLGLAAFTICMERLMGSPPCVTVLMRYTLRLLTAQQFQRAAALVLGAGGASSGEGARRRSGKRRNLDRPLGRSEPFAEQAQRCKGGAGRN